MRRALLACVFAVGLVLAVAPQALAAQTLVVDKDKVQCPRAGFTSIQAAVTAALPGDTIKVCPDQYNESVVVNKPSLTLVGATSVNINRCTTVTAADPTKDSIVTGAGSFSFSFQNNNISLSGFVVQGSVNGINTSDAFSGYRITNTIAQFNRDWGINLNSSGTNPSRVDHNCLRRNSPGLGFLADGLASEIGNVSNALIDHNATYQNAGGGVDLSGAGARAYVTVTQNSSVQDGFAGVSIDNTIGSVVSQNTSQGSTRGIAVGGSNNGLSITGNVSTGGGNGIIFNQATFIPVFPGPNVGLNVSGNTVSRASGTGIVAVQNAPNLTLSVVSNNNTFANGASGIRLGLSNNNNQVLNNAADKNNNYGIYANLAVGNAFANNHMSLNVLADARDDNRPANTWTGNQCTTDVPAGTIC
jgi:parallel beta-helix repeat protein